LISKKFEKEIVFESSVLAWIWIRIRIEQKCWIRIRKKSIRIHNPEKKPIKPKKTCLGGFFRRFFWVLLGGFFWAVFLLPTLDISQVLVVSIVFIDSVPLLQQTLGPVRHTVE
jgi:hypothetical protein